MESPSSRILRRCLQRLLGLAVEASRIPQSRKVLLAMLAVDMGGRAAEEIILGKGQATMGAQSDIDEATRTATQMIATGGLSQARP